MRRAENTHKHHQYKTTAETQWNMKFNVENKIEPIAFVSVEKLEKKNNLALCLCQWNICEHGHLFVYCEHSSGAVHWFDTVWLGEMLLYISNFSISTHSVFHIHFQ